MPSFTDDRRKAGKLNLRRAAPTEADCVLRIIRELRSVEANWCKYGSSLSDAIQNTFRRTLESGLRQVYPGVEVFWALDKKPEAPTKELPESPSHDKFTNSLRQSLIRLNRNYHTHPFLLPLTHVSIGISQVFSIYPLAKKNGSRLIAQPLVHRGSVYRTKRFALDVHFGPPGCICQSRTRLQSEWDNGSPGQLDRLVESQLASWKASSTTSWKSGAFLSLVDADVRTHYEKDIEAIHAKLLDAIPHLALIALYQENLGYSAMTYLMAHASEKVTRSTAGIYWPRQRGEGSAELLCQLQMILGQHGTALGVLSREYELVQQRIQAKDAEIAAKEGAILHYGHTMGHRVAPVVRYFRQHGVRSEAAGCAWLIEHLSLVLQAYAVRSERDFFDLNAAKGDRFVVRTKNLALLKLIRHDVARATSKAVQTSKGVIYRSPHFDCRLRSATVVPNITDSLERGKCRLHDAFYAQLFTELVLNIVQHGWHRDVRPKWRSPDGLVMPRANVPVAITSLKIDSHDTIVLSNYYQSDAKPPPSFFRDEWTEWPRNRPNDGPGMAIAVLRAIGAGSMWLRAEPPIGEQAGQFHVAVWLKGLVLS